ncbi:MAG: hypothetical protein NT091_02625, partial [Candidatus Falkowbacteria bacterium]|nr:hypothetical protein [Candidatus Falkowbacteria bacterium]
MERIPKSSLKKEEVKVIVGSNGNGLNQEEKLVPEIESVRSDFVDFLKDYKFDAAIQLSNDFKLDKKFVREAIQSEFLVNLKIGSLYAALEMVEKFNLNDEFLKSNEVQKYLESNIMAVIGHDIKIASNIKTKLKLSKQFIESSLNQEYLQEEFRKNFKKGNIYGSFEIAYVIGLKDEFLESTEFKEIIEWTCMQNLKDCNINTVVEIYSLFGSSLGSGFFYNKELENISQDAKFQRGLVDYFFCHWLSSKDDKEKVFPWLSQEVMDQAVVSAFKKHVKDQNWLIVDNLFRSLSDEQKQLVEIELPGIVGQIKNQADKEKEQEAIEPVNREAVRKDYSQIELSKELLTFYSNQYLSVAILDKEVEFKRGKELKIKDRIFLNEQEEKVETNIKRTFDWMQVYLVKAVLSELEHQDQLFSKPIGTGFENDEEFLTKAIGSEARSFLLLAINKFNESGWAESYGGSPWAKIATLTYDFYLDDLNVNDKQMKIDRAFQLEHNTGLVFDKDPGQVTFSKEREKKFLDLKFKARNLDELSEGA